MLRLHVPAVTSDPVVVYDVMWEATNRLTSLFVGQVTVGGMDDPAIQRIREYRSRAEAIDPDDLDAQRQLTAEYSHLRDELLLSGL
jgi:hypothetical protein